MATDILNITEITPNQQQKEVVANAGFAELEKIAGRLPITTTSGTVALTDSQGRYGLIELTGVLVGDLILEYPATLDGVVDILNSTTGSFKVEVRYDSGGTLNRIPRGKIALFWQQGFEILSDQIFPKFVVPDLYSGWVNKGTVESAKSDGVGGGLYLEAAASAGSKIVIYTKTAPSTPYVVTIAFISHLYWVATSMCGICLYESSTDKFTAWGREKAQNIVMSNWTNDTTYSSTLTWDTMYGQGGVEWFRIEDNGTNIKTAHSYDGVNFDPRGQIGRTSFMAGGPDLYGFYVNSNDAARPAGITILSVEVT